jgi:enoyl-CoA hydratase/carnithine racemase
MGFDGAAARVLTADQIPCERDWLAQQSSVVIGLSDESDKQEPHYNADLWIASSDEALRLLDRVERNPLAALLLVQVLRVIESLPMELALKVESMAYSVLQAGPEFAAWREKARGDPRASVSKPDDPPLRVSVEGNVLILELDRPGARNALDLSLRDALCEVLETALLDPDRPQILLRGLGSCFSVGGDLSTFGLFPDPARAHQVRTIRQPGLLFGRCADRLEAHVHGACIGSGIEMPAFAAKLVAHPKSFFQLPELSMGLLPGAGGCYSIGRRIGRHRLAWWVLSGRKINAQTALEWGLVDRVDPESWCGSA